MAETLEAKYDAERSSTTDSVRFVAPSMGFDSAALEAATSRDVALCTLVKIDGGFSRSVGAQMAVHGEIAVAGDMTGGCLEAALIADVIAARAAGRPRLVRYGSGSPYIDIRLPCGGGVECYIDPEPDRSVIKDAVARLRRREPVALSFDIVENPRTYTAAGVGDRRASGFYADPGRFTRVYAPQLRILAFGTGPELEVLNQFSALYGCAVELFGPAGRDRVGDAKPIFLGAAPADVAVDAWTAIVLLFHEHEWEIPILRWALSTEAYYIGALGGAKTVQGRRLALKEAGVGEKAIKRIHAPIGLIPRVKDARTLGLSILADVAGRYLNPSDLDQP